ncbi:thioesterase family protein [Ferrimonas lipolytica]|uniref:Medium/long-chain acyl-CoA thioesterase YigI n=1 Tax=Ferrimonas lipolytica TaxID=2724191 RepID=A0A6H1UHJ5_9GAMM|nr:thioesterase family protein [Ferrimonas lipolytica]QIZ78099.1 thioesterase family protein [Ferrimonas lipolytica]
MNDSNAQQRRLLAQIQTLFAKEIPFHQLLQVEINHYDLNGLEVALTMRPELIGNPGHQILHGGVTATLLDVAGGMTAFAGVIERHPEAQADEIMARLANLGTIDLRIDYLRPGRGKQFIATGKVIRTGNKVAVVRMELHNHQGDHIAAGTGTYLVG